MKSGGRVEQPVPAREPVLQTGHEDRVRSGRSVRAEKRQKQVQGNDEPARSRLDERSHFLGNHEGVEGDDNAPGHPGPKKCSEVFRDIRQEHPNPFTRQESARAQHRGHALTLVEQLLVGHFLPVIPARYSVRRPANCLLQKPVDRLCRVIQVGGDVPRIMRNPRAIGQMGAGQHEAPSSDATVGKRWQRT